MFIRTAIIFLKTSFPEAIFNCFAFHLLPSASQYFGRKSAVYIWRLIALHVKEKAFDKTSLVGSLHEMYDSLVNWLQYRGRIWRKVGQLNCCDWGDFMRLEQLSRKNSTFLYYFVIPRLNCNNQLLNMSFFIHAFLFAVHSTGTFFMGCKAQGCLAFPITNRFGFLVPLMLQQINTNAS